MRSSESEIELNIHSPRSDGVSQFGMGTADSVSQ